MNRNVNIFFDNKFQASYTQHTTTNREDKSMRFKKIMTLLLIMCVIFSMLSAAFIAYADVTSEQELEDALAAAGTGDIITITNDIIITGHISVPVGVTLMIDGEDFGYTITIIDGGSLQNDGIINLIGGTFEISRGGSIVNKSGGFIYNNDTIDNSGSVVNDGHIENDGEFCNLAWGVIENPEGGTIENNGAIDNFGMIENAGSIVNNGWLNNNSGAVINNSGFIKNLWEFVDNGTFINTGTFEDNGKEPGDTEDPLPPSYVPVTDITGVPASAAARTPLSLASAAVFPANATNKAITWRVSSAGTTGATISGNTFNATAAGTAIITATVVNGATSTTNFTKTFTIMVDAVGNPAISGKAAMTLQEGYAATSSDVFTITGNPAPTVTKVSGDAKITWNNSTKRLNITAGLTKGRYPVTIRAANGKTPDATFTFTLTVTEKSVSGMTNFVKINTYTRGQFTDVDETRWYGFDQQKVIAGAFEYGLVQGVGARPPRYAPTGNFTVAQALTIAARVHSIYNTGKAGFVQGSVWYQVYVDYCLANDIIKSGEFVSVTRAATRAEMAYIFARALPVEEYAALNTVNSLPDVNSSTPYYDSIILLYEAGILVGDNNGTFYPGNDITRAEAAALMSRLILPATRISGRVYE